ncbi:MAG: hypothetical protein NVS4B2_22850 [Chloroflexota bacterium]
MQQSITTCAQCGAPVRGRFCTACGTRIAEPQDGSDQKVDGPPRHDPDATATLNKADLDVVLQNERELQPGPGSESSQVEEQEQGKLTAESPVAAASGTWNSPSTLAVESPARDAPPMPAGGEAVAQEKPRGFLTRLVLRLFSGFGSRQFD